MIPADSEHCLGQVFIAGLPGPELDEDTQAFIKAEKVGNFILFRRNVESPAQLWRLCRDLRQACLDAGLPPPLLAIDQEGGTVARLRPPFTQFPAARAQAEGPEPEAAALRFGRLSADELGKIGVTMNLAPVLDVCAAGNGFYMESRSWGADPERVAHLGGLIIGALQAGGVAACAKHFPGLGGARIDPHRSISAIERSVEQLYREDIPPFRAAGLAGVAAIMTSHTLYPQLDPLRPATLSPKILTAILRATLDYQGVVITDDLEMGAIEYEQPVAAAALAAFHAGADMLLICHSQEKVREAKRAMAAALLDSTLATQRLWESVARVRKLKERFPGRQMAKSETTLIEMFPA